mmetsp:Transcript_78776/g.200527  ORF Transcript_78776/g.200527 Transcript_78776/m.200527 type:complete len:80 (-) Transcript_78776:620-859(-)
MGRPEVLPALVLLAPAAAPEEGEATVPDEPEAVLPAPAPARRPRQASGQAKAGKEEAEPEDICLKALALDESGAEALRE